MLGEQLLIDPRLVVIALSERKGRKFGKVMIALQVSGQENYMICALLSGDIASIGMFPTGDVCLHTNYRLDPRRLHLIIERYCAVKITVIGDRHRSRAQPLRSLSQRLYLYSPVQKTEVSVKMEVYKVFFVHCFSLRFNDPIPGSCRSWLHCDRSVQDSSVTAILMIPVLRVRSLAQASQGVYRKL